MSTKITEKEPDTITHCQHCLAITAFGYISNTWNECKMCRRRICYNCIAKTTGGDGDRFMVNYLIVFKFILV
jgi:hypothetical protein